MNNSMKKQGMNVLAKKLFGVWMLLAACVGMGTVHAQTVEYIHTDSLGTPVAVTDANRNVIERSEYEPYGMLLNRPISDGPGYTGHVMDAATGLTYMQQRYFDPGIGRFLSVDPVAARLIGDNFNRYGYAANNPYKFVDPDGRDWVFGVHTYTNTDRSKNTGHSWTSIREVGSSKTTTHGLWMDGHVTGGGRQRPVPDNGSGSDVRVNMEAKAGYDKASQSAFFTVTDGQKASFDEFSSQNQQYGLVTNNCADFVVGAIEATTGIEVSAGLVSNPGTLSLKVDILRSLSDTNTPASSGQGTLPAISPEKQKEIKRELEY